MLTSVVLRSSPTARCVRAVIPSRRRDRAAPGQWYSTRSSTVFVMLLALVTVLIFIIIVFLLVSASGPGYFSTGPDPGFSGFPSGPDIPPVPTASLLRSNRPVRHRTWHGRNPPTVRSWPGYFCTGPDPGLCGFPSASRPPVFSSATSLARCQRRFPARRPRRECPWLLAARCLSVHERPTHRWWRRAFCSLPSGFRDLAAQRHSATFPGINSPGSSPVSNLLLCTLVGSKHLPVVAPSVVGVASTTTQAHHALKGGLRRA